MPKEDFILEIGCEELPPLTLENLSNTLAERLSDALIENELEFEGVRAYATPRRLAVYVNQLSLQQKNQVIERQGPSYESAFDKDGTPTLACIGFANSCGVTAEELDIIDTPKGKRIFVKAFKEGGKSTILLPDIINNVINKLPISRPMRWGANSDSFIRPVHWVLMMHGEHQIACEVFGIQSSNQTHGHRFHHPEALCLHHANQYETILEEQGHVIPSFQKRKALIMQSIQNCVPENFEALIQPSLLNEVCALVEWPTAVMASFDATFLLVPKEVLMTSMETHIKCFPVLHPDGSLAPHFVLITNIDDQSHTLIRKGYEKVIRARLSDAEFFYTQDKKTELITKSQQLNEVIYQKQLGTLSDKTQRIKAISSWLTQSITADESIVSEAATLCKCDLITDMVVEFPKLQGIMGYYYALNDGVSTDVAVCIKEQYLPKFSGDALPSSNESAIIALADRIDLIVGIHAINKKPSGDKDPFGLRRAALGIIRIMLDRQLDIDLKSLITYSHQHMPVECQTLNTVDEVYEFILSRLKSWYLDQEIPVEIFEAVAESDSNNLIDFDRRVRAVLAFTALPEAEHLSAANKRVNNILKKSGPAQEVLVNSAMFEKDAEHSLHQEIDATEKEYSPLLKEKHYNEALKTLARLKPSIDRFFEEVMIMHEDDAIRNNRIALLSKLHHLFTNIADISRLS